MMNKLLFFGINCSVDGPDFEGIEMLRQIWLHMRVGGRPLWNLGMVWFWTGY
jgi:hypothetical protein